MANAPTTSKFSAKRVGDGADKSPGKAIITGDPGVGKTYFLSTIESRDGRPIFLVPAEEGLKGASPHHAPAKFVDGHGNPIKPDTFEELLEAMRVFRDEINAPRPPKGWAEGLDLPAAAAALLGIFVEAFPFPLHLEAAAETAKITEPGVALDQLLKAQRVRKVDQTGAYQAKPDAAWRRPHIHFGIDSLSGVELLIHKKVLQVNNVTSMADREYNALYEKAQPHWDAFRDGLDAIRRTGVHVWVIAHCTEGYEASAETGQVYKARELMFRGSGQKLVEIRKYWMQWADSIFYIMQSVKVREGDKKRRTTAEFMGRMLVTSATAQCKAKSRYAIPPVLPATWQDLRAAMESGIPAPATKLRAKIIELAMQVDPAERDSITTEANALQAPTALAALLSRVEGMILCNDAPELEEDEAAEEEKGAPAGRPEPQGLPHAEDHHLDGGL